MVDSVECRAQIKFHKDQHALLITRAGWQRVEISAPFFLLVPVGNELSSGFVLFLILLLMAAGNKLRFRLRYFLFLFLFVSRCNVMSVCVGFSAIRLNTCNQLP